MPKDTKTLCIKKGCASVLTQPPATTGSLTAKTSMNKGIQTNC